MKPGDCINIPAEVKHWHGAASDSWFSHLAIEVPGEQTSTEWCEPVTDAQYDAVQNQQHKKQNFKKRCIKSKSQMICNQLQIIWLFVCMTPYDGNNPKQFGGKFA